MLETEPKVNLMKREVDSWRPFVDALRSDDREAARRMIQDCYRLAGAIESSGKTYTTEPFFFSLLLLQRETTVQLKAELEALEAKAGAWKRAGS